MPSIVGTWKLVRAVARDGSGATLPEPYGGKGIGRVTFTADGRMQSMVCDGRKEMPAGVARDYSSDCGNYTLDGTRLVTRVRVGLAVGDLAHRVLREILPERVFGISRSPVKTAPRNGSSALFVAKPRARAYAFSLRSGIRSMHEKNLRFVCTLLASRLIGMQRARR